MYKKIFLFILIFTTASFAFTQEIEVASDSEYTEEMNNSNEQINPKTGFPLITDKPFVIFVNDKELMHFSYTRYLENKIREAFGFKGTSLRFIIRERKEKDQ